MTGFILIIIALLVLETGVIGWAVMSIRHRLDVIEFREYRRERGL